MPVPDVTAWVQQWQPENSWAMWNDPVLGENARDLVLANIKHRHWIRDVQNYVTGASEIVPPLGVGDCPLGLWLTANGYARYNQHPLLDSVIQAHSAVHAAAKRLVECRQGGELAKAAVGLPELHALRDSLIESLAELSVGGDK
jgi:hypothetical protein